jgi:hypothetical protein
VYVCALFLLSFFCQRWIVMTPGVYLPPVPPESRLASTYSCRSPGVCSRTIRLVLSAAAAGIKGSCWHPQTANGFDGCHTIAGLGGCEAPSRAELPQSAQSLCFVRRKMVVPRGLHISKHSTRRVLWGVWSEYRTKYVSGRNYLCVYH